MLGAQGMFCRRLSFLPGYFYLLGETENYVKKNNALTGVFLKAEIQGLSVQVDTTEFRFQYYQ